MRVKRFVLGIGVAVGLGLVATPPARACSCDVMGASAPLWADPKFRGVLFVGTVRESYSMPHIPEGMPGGMQELTVDVHASWSGALCDQVRVLTSHSSCGAELALRRSYLIVGKPDEHGAIVTHACFDNRPWDPWIAPDLEKLRVRPRGKLPEFREQPGLAARLQRTLRKRPRGTLSDGKPVACPMMQVPSLMYPLLVGLARRGF